MKLMRLGTRGDEIAAIRLDQERIAELPDSYDGLSSHTFGSEILRKLADDFRANGNSFRTHAIKDFDRIGSPLCSVPDFICMGLNYRLHILEVHKDPAAAEAATLKIQKEGPPIFFKAASSLCGPDDSIIIPPGSLKTDYEVEVGIVIGKRCYRVDSSQAASCIAGFVAVNDISEREHQIEISSGQWAKGKGHPSFGPVGPWLVTPDEISDPRNMKMWLRVNGELRQDSNTSDMLHGLYDLVSYVSRYMELSPGTIISSGTPPGVGMGQKPNPIFLKPGDVVTMEIEGLGSRRQEVIAAK